MHVYICFFGYFYELVVVRPIAIVFIHSTIPQTRKYSVLLRTQEFRQVAVFNITSSIFFRNVQRRRKVNEEYYPNGLSESSYLYRQEEFNNLVSRPSYADVFIDDGLAKLQGTKLLERFVAPDALEVVCRVFQNWQLTRTEVRAEAPRLRPPSSQMRFCEQYHLCMCSGVKYSFTF